MRTRNEEIVIVQSKYYGQMKTRFPLNEEHKEILKDFLRSYKKSNVLIKPYESFWTYIDGINFYADEVIEKRLQYIMDSWGEWENLLSNRSERMDQYRFTMKEKILANTTKIHFASSKKGYNYQRVFLGWLAFQLDIPDCDIPYSLTGASRFWYPLW